MEPKDRLSEIDSLRGFAIIMMVWANLSPYYIELPYPFWFRLIGTWAAPIFIFLTGLMIGLNSKKSTTSFKRIIQRSIVLLTVAALLDIQYGIFPFVTFDVLYLIGFTTPFAFLINRIQKHVKIIIVLFCIILGQVLQMIFVYNSILFEISIETSLSIYFTSFPSIFRNFFFEGWFPLFPWSGVMIAGSFVGYELDLYKKDSKRLNSIFLISISILSVGIVIEFLFPSPMIPRMGYSELFYPATISFILVSFGVIGIFYRLFVFGENKVKFISLSLHYLGKNSLASYISHILLISFLSWFFVGSESFLLVFLIIILLLVLFGFILSNLRRKLPERGWILRMFIG